ncbi:hypothetical protein [Pinirhizobacter soli]|uniref:hypothetical protein n=1 Tax=Pinirhizobacter soli TaxID=2786953 RepID=UPI00202A9C5C|nr:hypothetical protein [Pinirhizobacter soli]
MVTYAVPCRDGQSSDCFKTVEVDIGVPGLSPEEIDALLAATPEPVVPELPAGVTVDGTYFVPVELDDTVCAACQKARAEGMAYTPVGHDHPEGH